MPSQPCADLAKPWPCIWLYYKMCKYTNELHLPNSPDQTEKLTYACCYSFLHPALCHLQTWSAAILSLPLNSGMFLHCTVNSETPVLPPVLCLLELPDYVLCTFGLDFPYGVVSWPCSSQRLHAESVFIKYYLKLTRCAADSSDLFCQVHYF